MGRIFFRIAAALAMLALPSAIAAAQESADATASLQSPSAALAQDAAEYARRHEVGLDEALRRLSAQAETVAATDRLQRVYRKRLAGIAIEHSPEYRIVVLLTGKKRVREQHVFAGGMSVPIVFRSGAAATREEIVTAMRRRAGAIRSAVPQARGMGADPRSGELVIMLSEENAGRLDLAALDARLEEIAEVPVRLRILERPEANFAIEGGARVEGIDTVSGRRTYCTTGFVVTDGARTGIVTAAHCPDALTYFDPGGGRSDLPFLGQWGWSFRDVQLNVSDQAQRPLFYADTAKTTVRTLHGARTRASTRAGEVVCHRGERSGYSCSEVELTDYAPPGDLCGGPCEPVWVTVRGPSCGGGDSGGPVFLGNTAYGIVKGGTSSRTDKCAFYYYMSVDFLPDGWSLLRGSDAAAGESAPVEALSAVEPER